MQPYIAILSTTAQMCVTLLKQQAELRMVSQEHLQDTAEFFKMQAKLVEQLIPNAKPSIEREPIIVHRSALSVGREDVVRFVEGPLAGLTGKIDSVNEGEEGAEYHISLLEGKGAYSVGDLVTVRLYEFQLV